MRLLLLRTFLEVLLCVASDLGRGSSFDGSLDEFPLKGERWRYADKGLVGEIFERLNCSCWDIVETHL